MASKNSTLRQLLVGRFFLFCVLGIFFTAGTGCQRPKERSQGTASSSESTKADESELATNNDGLAITTSQVEIAEAAKATATMEDSSGAVVGAGTLRRLIVLSDDGPVIIDLQFQVGQQDLESSFRQSCQSVADVIIGKASQELDWSSVIQHPWVQSGWLAEPPEDTTQLQQLLDQHEIDFDQRVDSDQLTRFLCQAFIQVRMPIVNEPRQKSIRFGSRLNSIFGLLDSDQDNVLQSNERDTGTVRLMELDADHDQRITLPEIESYENSLASGNGMAGMTRSSMIDSQSLVLWPDTSDQERVRINQLVEHYSYNGVISREQWLSLSDLQWDHLDKNSDAQLTFSELTELRSVPASVRITLRTAAPGSTNQPAEWLIELLDGPSNVQHDRGKSCVVELAGIHVLIDFQDYLNARMTDVVREQLLQTIATEAQENNSNELTPLARVAWKPGDIDGDGRLSPQEFDSVWNWLTLGTAGSIECQWSVTSRPWRQLLDTDGDMVLSEMELARLPQRFLALDRNQDGQVEQDELPQVFRLEIVRRESRLAALNNGPTSGEMQGSAPDDWFSAMDANSDGVISPAEFLGSDSDFKAYDSDLDGYLSRSEVY